MLEGKGYLHIILITIIAILFSLFNIAIYFIDTIFYVLLQYTNLAVANFLKNFIFIYLLGLLWFAWKQWRQTENEKKKLDDTVKLVSQTQNVTEVKELYEELARVKSELARYVAPPTVEIVQEIITGRKVHPGALINVTVLFSDIRDFTSISENMEPHEVFKMLNRNISMQLKTIEEYHGIVDKLSGDEVMAVFSGPEMAENAIKCAMIIVNGFKKQEFLEDGWIGVGIGINTGPVYLGPLGSENRKQFTHIGSTVNIAARLCGQAKRFEVLFGKTTQELIAHKGFNYISMGSISLKGLSAPLEAFRLSI